MQMADAYPVKEFEIRLIGALLHRQSRVVVTTALAVFGLAVVFLVTVTPTYTATALILVDPDNQNILNPGAAFPASSGRDNARIDSEVEILKSDAVALSVITREGLTNDPEFGATPGISARLARAIGITSATPADAQQHRIQTLARFKNATSIRRKGLTYLITVSATSRSPTRAAELANKLSAAYITQQVQAKISRSLAARDVLDSQIFAAQASLATYQTALDRFIDDNMDRMADGAVASPLASIRTELDQAERLLKDKVQDQIDARLLLQRENWGALGAELDDEVIGKLFGRRTEIVTSISGQPAGETPFALHQALAVLDDRLSAQSAVGLRALSAQVQDIDQNILALRGQMRQTVLASDLSPGVLTEIYTIQRETSIARAQYDDLLSRLRYLETQAQIQIADSRIVSPALAPVRATFPNRNLVLLVALAASMGLGISLAFLKEYYIGGVTSDLQLGELLGTASATSIPNEAVHNSNRLGIADLVTDAPLSEYSESMRKLRAAIDQTLRPQSNAVPDAMPGTGGPGLLSGGKIILVTSALANEGKTTVALSLARTYAQAGVKTLLIDADLRRPSVHRLLGFDPPIGFLDYLRNASDTEISGSFYAQDPASPLALIMGAARSEYPTDQLLCSATFEALLAQARDVYAVIIVDSPPLLPVVDARYIAHHADAVALVVKWAATGQGDLGAALRPLRAAMKPGAALLPVLSQVQARGRRSDYGGYGGGYGDRYQQGYSAAI